MLHDKMRQDIQFVKVEPPVSPSILFKYSADTIKVSHLCQMRRSDPCIFLRRSDPCIFQVDPPDDANDGGGISDPSESELTAH